MVAVALWNSFWLNHAWSAHPPLLRTASTTLSRPSTHLEAAPRCQPSFGCPTFDLRVCPAWLEWLRVRVHHPSGWSVRRVFTMATFSPHFPPLCCHFLPSDVPDGFLGLAHFKKHTQSCGVIGHDVKSPSGDRLRVIPSRWV